MTMTKDDAFNAMLAHHQQLREQVAHRVILLENVVVAGAAYDIVRAELVTYLVDEVLPHALAEENTIYPEAALRSEMATTVEAMVAEHRELAIGIERLASAANGPDAVQRALFVGALFAEHVSRENEVLLPALVADDAVDLAQLLAQMHQLTRTGHDEPTSIHNGSPTDHEAVVLSRLLEAATELARAGQGDRACSLVASVWATLREPRPDLASRVNLALHGLVRLVTQEPVAVRSKTTVNDPASDSVLDVRSLAPAQRHETIFDTYQALEAGSAFLLVNDHDPKPLRYQFEAEHAGEFTWDYVQSGPKVWRVRIGRALAGARSALPRAQRS